MATQAASPGPRKMQIFVAYEGDNSDITNVQRHIDVLKSPPVSADVVVVSIHPNSGVNDIITTGAKPLFFLDYIAAHSLEMSAGDLDEVFSGIVEACRFTRTALIGGETAEIGSYPSGMD